jgi:hydroxymethylglutaryl-CoA lyase
MTEKVAVCEVGPRDGLQNEKAHLSAAQKCALVDGLVRAGARYIELGSFVNPKAVPQMADTEAVFAHALARYPDVRFTGLVINERGYERALAAGCRAVAIVVIASETWSRRNSHMSTVESVALCRKLLARARADGVWARVYLSAAWHCPYEGPTPSERVIALADEIWAEGVAELAVADSIGHAHPLEVGRLMERLGARFEMGKLAVHLHDTQALGSANAYAALSAGVRIVDASVGGLGGCPFAPGTAGNLATEDFVFMAHKMGYDTGLNLDALWPVVSDADGMLGRRVGGRVRGWWETQVAGWQVAS